MKFQIKFENKTSEVKMSRYKSTELKKKLAKAMKQNRRIPVFVVARTKRKVTFNRKMRNWRNKKMKIKIK